MSFKNDHKPYSILNDFDDLGVMALASLAGAAIWPLTLLIIVFFFIFNCLLKESFNKLAEWLSDRL